MLLLLLLLLQQTNTISFNNRSSLSFTSTKLRFFIPPPSLFSYVKQITLKVFLFHYCFDTFYTFSTYVNCYNEYCNSFISALSEVFFQNDVSIQFLLFQRNFCLFVERFNVDDVNGRSNVHQYYVNTPSRLLR